MSSLIRLKVWLLVLGVLASFGSRAADIDLFANSQSGSGNAPHVLFIIDTAAAFSANNDAFFCNISAAGVVTTTSTTADATLLNKTNGGVEQCALYSVIKSLEESTVTVNVGVMMFNNKQKTYDAATDTFNSDNCSSGYGGCLILPLVQLNSTTGPRIREWIRRWDTSGTNSNYYIKAPSNMGVGATMQEAWAYYFGKTGLSGRAYTAPSGDCSQKNIIYLGNNWEQQATPKDTTNPTNTKSPLGALRGLNSTAAMNATPTATVDEYTAVQATASTVCTGAASTSTLDTSEGNGASAINWAMYMRNQGLVDTTKGVTTYAIAMEQFGCDKNYGIWLPTLADKGGGEFYAVNSYETLVEKLKTVLGNIASVNSVFAAVSLPVSVNTQGTYLNDIYVGMFRPAQHFYPRWNGNLKQYKLGKINNQLKMLDADDAAAINTQTGFLTECARSFWTPKTLDTYWTNEPSGGCIGTNYQKSNTPDGNIVEKGAQAYKLRAISPSTRNVKTCSTSFPGCTSLIDFSTATAAVTAALSTDLVNWGRGANLDAELSMATTVMRSSAHGDVVHSRPIPVNHGTDADPKIVVYYGANDGMLRAVNGNRGSATYTVTGVITSGSQSFEAGTEIWSFVPPEFYGNFQTLRDNTTVIGSPATNANAATQKRYGIDGPITAFQGTIGGVSKVYVYATMRRGGRAIYAFDTTDIANPSLLWKRGCPNASDDTDCSAGYAGIGQTWSSLKTLHATGHLSGASPLLITGGGYDTCEDHDVISGGTAYNNNCTSSSKGRKVYIIDAVNGDVIKAFDTDRPVIADATLVKDGATGMIKYAYTADLGGNVYRMTFGSGAPATWTITKIASLGCSGLSSCTANRKFMFQPSVVTTDQDTFFVMLGSGDREKPIQAYTASKTVANYFFMVKDTISNGAASYTDTTNCGPSTSTLCLNSLAAIGATNPTQAELNAKPKGWYLALNSANGEQVVTSALTIFGVVTFSTHQPAAAAVTGQCKPNLGTTNVYNISYLNAATANGTQNRYEHVSGDGLPPSPVGGQVTLDDGTTVPFCIGCSKESPLEGAPPRTLSTVTQPTNRLYRYIQK